jgi:hypothetical protein
MPLRAFFYSAAIEILLSTAGEIFAIHFPRRFPIPEKKGNHNIADLKLEQRSLNIKTTKIISTFPENKS